MKQIILLFEGHDYSGKTQIARELSRLIDIPYFKNIRENEAFNRDELKYFTKYGGIYLADFLRQTGYSAIIDRSYPSEYVYSTVLDRDSCENIFEIDKIFALMGTQIIYCFKEDLTGYKDNLIDIELIPKIKIVYDKFFKLTKCRYYKLNTDNVDLNWQIKKILGYLNG